jgi:hypothetical protein
MVGSNSNNTAAPKVPPAANTAAPNVLVTPVANITAPEINAVAGTAQRSTPSMTCTPTYVGGPSTAAELDAIKVTKLRWLNLHFPHCVTYTLAQHLAYTCFRRPRAPTFLALSYITLTAC